MGFLGVFSVHGKEGGIPKTCPLERWMKCLILSFSAFFAKIFVAITFKLKYFS